MGSLRFIWGVISPSAVHSVGYLRSVHATAAASQVNCSEYLAVILDPFDRPGPLTIAFVVQPSHHPLPEHFLPILPCRLGSREPLDPGFEWPFEECVIDTSKPLHFELALPLADLENGHILPHDSALYFSSIYLGDLAKRMPIKKPEREAEGANSVEGSRLTADSTRNSLIAEIPPGRFFSPDWISAQIRYNIECLNYLPTARQCFDDQIEVKRVRARFSRPETDRTIQWTINQTSCPPGPPVEDDIGECNPSLVEFSATLERPEETNQIVDQLAEEDEDLEWGNESFPAVLTRLPPPPRLDVRALQIIYFDIYGTLIDKETGIYNAIQPLFARSSHRFERPEALSFYLESEIDIKRCTPAAPYSEILAIAYHDVATRLNLTATTKESLRFASSILHWPLFDDVLPGLRSLKPRIPILVALADIDHENLCKTSSFLLVAGYFTEVHTWDACRAYRPDPGTLTPSFIHHDETGVPRSRRCLVSNSLVRDIEPACWLNVPGIWMRYPTSMAAQLPVNAGSMACGVYATLPGVISGILAAKEMAGNIHESVKSGQS
ncbi:hypothetical protein C8R43DRAFT_1000910 [Mycena crocata]|nr:hypothetical protein C8R43DRAFT_1000910 [Mycena crocata]